MAILEPRQSLPASPADSPLTEAAPATRPRRLNGHKLGHVPILQKPLSEIYPSPENEQLYRPVLPEDPATVALADSIRQHGVREPLVITLDGWLLSGHRRHVAARLAGLEMVPCRVEQFRRGDDHDRFVVLLREYNRQRVKTLDEALREEVVSCDPEQAYQSLIKHRQQTAVDALDDVDCLTLGTGRRRAEITAAKGPFLRAIQAIIKKRRNFWPLSDRQIHYALLNDPPLIHASKPHSHYANTTPSYKALIDLLTRARLAGDIPMDCIADETRPVTTWTVYKCAPDYIREELKDCFKGYWRDLMQSQPNHIEILVEKNTVTQILKPVAMEYCIPFTSGRGFCSLPPRHAIAQRFRKSGKDSLVLLIVSDFDPDGEEIAASFARSMRDDFDVSSTLATKVALTAFQAETFDLPPALKAKTTSVNYRKFSAKHGDDVYELEAVEPEQLQLLLREAVDQVLDVDAFNAELDAEKADAEFLENTRRRVKAALAGVVASEQGDGDGGPVE